MPADSRHYFKELRLQQFRGLVALSRWQTFSAAAAALRLTRTSVWQQVHALEKEFGCALVRTRGQRVELTLEGRRLVELASPLVEGFDSIKAAFDSGRDRVPQSLVVATTPTCLAHELREPIARLRTLHPRLHLTFLDRNSPAAIDLLEHGEADVAIAARLDEWPARPALEFFPFASCPFTLICPPGHPLLAKPRLTLRDFAGPPLILPGQGANCRPRIEQRFGRARLWEKLNIVLECSFPVVIFDYVSNGLGVALTPVSSELWRARRSPARLEKFDVVVRDVSDLFGHEPLHYIRRRGQIESAHLATFRELVLGKAGAGGSQER